jgi:hypothetical protein
LKKVAGNNTAVNRQNDSLLFDNNNVGIMVIRPRKEWAYLWLVYYLAIDLHLDGLGSDDEESHTWSQRLG